MSMWSIILIVAAIIIGLLYFNVRGGRKKRQGGSK